MERPLTLNNGERGRFSRLTMPLVFAIPAFVAFSAWSGTLSFGFLSDDFIFIFFASNATPADFIKNFYQLEGAIFCRPLVHLLWGFDTFLWARETWGYHLTNLLLHSANASMVAILTRKVSKNPRVSVAAGVIFAVYPAFAEVVAWLSGRYDLLSTFFYLTCLISFLNYRADAARRLWRAISLVSMLLAFMSKENAIVLPLAILATDLILCPRTRSVFKVNYPYWILTVVFLAYRTVSMRGVGLTGYDHGALSVTHVAGSLSATVLGPFNHHTTDARVILVFTLFVIFALSISIVATGADSFFSRKVLFSIVIFALPLITVIYLLPVVEDLRKSRLIYLPSVGFAIFTAIVLFPEKRKSYIGYLFIAPLLAGYISGIAWNLEPFEKAGRIAGKVIAETKEYCRGLPFGSKVYYIGLPDNIEGAYLFQNGITFALALENGYRLEDAGFNASVYRMETRLPITAWRINDKGDAGVHMEPGELADIVKRKDSCVLMWKAGPEKLTRLSQKRHKPTNIQSTKD